MQVERMEERNQYSNTVFTVLNNERIESSWASVECLHFLLHEKHFLFETLKSFLGISLRWKVSPKLS